MITVTKPFLPPKKDYFKYIDGIWERNHLTNMGPLANKLEMKLKEYLNINHLLFVTNGTIALQIAIKALRLKGEIITTPFTYVATSSSIVWEGCTPVYVDIDKNSLNIDSSKIEAAITKKTTAIVATHVFGNPCDVETIKNIADRHNLKVIYDGAHAFGVKLKGKSIFEYGDISTCSTHATKLFHTVEGGAIVFKDSSIFDKAKQLINFNLDSDGIPSGIGINAKLNEYQCAVGLTNLESIDEILTHRIMLYKLYTELLSQHVQLLKWDDNCSLNGSYMPIVFKNENEKLKVKRALDKSGIPSREYFSPSLNTIFKPKDSCPFSESVSSRILCLPIHFYLTVEEVKFISLTISESI